MANTGNEGGEKASRPSQPTQAATDSSRQAENAIRQGADQLRDQMTGMAGMSAKLSQDLIERSGQNFEMMKRIAETLASGVKSAVSEMRRICPEHGQAPGGDDAATHLSAEPE